ncbi:hypothetical protein [Candidatus Hodgkinia cicadicola]|uniref:hypothetical protein n=1 Tax=Candidatus Hodgkinia cicadicola TaxID=573658 RepID=UPI001788B2EE
MWLVIGFKMLVDADVMGVIRPMSQRDDGRHWSELVSWLEAEFNCSADGDRIENIETTRWCWKMGFEGWVFWFLEVV